MRRGVDFRQAQNPRSLLDRLPPDIGFPVAEEHFVNLHHLPLSAKFQLAHHVFPFRGGCHDILDDFDVAPDSAVIGTTEGLDCFGAHTQDGAVSHEKEKRDVEDRLPPQWRVLGTVETKVARATFTPWDRSISLIHRIFGLVTTRTHAIEKAMLEEEIEHSISTAKGVVCQMHAKHFDEN